jgi:hypothetical protein
MPPARFTDRLLWAAKTKSADWFPAPFAGYEESRNCLTMIKGRCAQTAVIPRRRPSDTGRLGVQHLVALGVAVWVASLAVTPRDGCCSPSRSTVAEEGMRAFLDKGNVSQCAVNCGTNIP